MVVEKEGDRYHPSAVVKWEQGGGFYTLITTFPVEKRYIESQKRKSSLFGSEPPAPAPAQAPTVADSSKSVPEGGAD